MNLAIENWFRKHTGVTLRCPTCGDVIAEKMAADINSGYFYCKCGQGSELEWQPRWWWRAKASLRPSERLPREWVNDWRSR